MNFHRLLTFLALLAISGCGNGGDNVSSAIGGGNVSAVDGGGLTSAVTPTANIPIVLPSGANGRQILGTRGFARVQADEFNTNKEAQTQFRVEFPYGASSGWKAAYQGYTQAFNIPNVTDSIVIQDGLCAWGDPSGLPGPLGWRTYGQQVLIDALIKVPERRVAGAAVTRRCDLQVPDHLRRH